MHRQELDLETYCDVRNFEHKSLFQRKSLFLWEYLDQLTEYLNEFKAWSIDSAISSHVILDNSNEISIGKNVTIEPFALIKGPCIIGDNAVIGHGALVRPYSIIGQGAVVGHCSEIKGSILLSQSKLPHFNYVGDSILGNRVNLGAGAICANVRLDQDLITVMHNGQKIKTHRKKLGAIIGDDSQIACNKVINPGTFLPKNTRVLP